MDHEYKLQKTMLNPKVCRFSSDTLCITLYSLILAKEWRFTTDYPEDAMVVQAYSFVDIGYRSRQNL